MGVYTTFKREPRSITESFFDQCEKMSSIDSKILSYTEETIPVFKNESKYFVEMSMVSKLMESKEYSLIEAVKALCEENDIGDKDLTVIIDPEEVEDYTEEKIEEMVNLLNEAWKNNITVAAKDDEGKYIELTINGTKTKIKVKNIDKQIEKTKKQLEKVKEKLDWWSSLSDDEKKSEKNKRTVIQIILLGLSLSASIFGIATANPLIGIISSTIGLGFSTASIGRQSGKDGVAMINVDKILDQNGDKIYKNTDDMLKRTIDVYEKVIKALEDYKKKNVK